MLMRMIEAESEPHILLVLQSEDVRKLIVGYSSLHDIPHGLLDVLRVARIGSQCCRPAYACPLRCWVLPTTDGTHRQSNG